MTAPRGQRLDLVVGDDPPARPAAAPDRIAPERIGPGRAASAKPFLGVHFRCCGVYSRVTLARAGDRYAGACPKCFRPVVFRIGPGGSDSRFFTVS